MSDNGSARKLVAFVQEQRIIQNNKLTEDAANALAIKVLLGELGKLSTQDDSIKFEGTKFVLPAQYEGRTNEAVDFLNQYHRSMEKHYEFSKTFPYRPNDGAHAFAAAMRSMFGNAGIGKNRPATFFSPERPPQMITIDTGVNSTDQVPWGEVEFAPLEATFNVGSTHDPERGIVFALAVDAPKKYRAHVDAFYQLVEDELRERSIYRGKAITGAKIPTYVDLSKIDPAKVVYSDDVLTQLETNLWSLLKYTELQRELGLSLKRAVLVEGPYGTGKTLAGMLTAKEAVDHGWTFILCRTGKDDLFEVLRTAQLYAPAVVWYEDIDTLAKGGTDEDISKLLDALDGIQGKGAEVVAGFTTNHVDKIQKGVLRPGRLDAVIHIGELDAAGYKKLIHSLVPNQLLGEINYDLVVKSFKDFLPAFVTEAINNALRYAITRTQGNPAKIETEDLTNSALALRPQLELMQGAKEGANVATVDSVLRERLLPEVMNRFEIGLDTEGNRGLVYNSERVVSTE